MASEVLTAPEKKTAGDLPEPAWAKDDAAFEAFAKKRGEPAWLTERRREAFAAYRGLRYPTMTDEPWRRTSLAGLDLAQAAPYAANGAAGAASPSAELTDFDVPAGELAGELLFRDGRVARHAAPTGGVVLLPLSEACRTREDLVKKHLGTRCLTSEEKFKALSNAFWDHGCLLYVPDGVTVEKPLRLAYSYGASSPAHYPRTLLVVGKNARATVLQEILSPTDGVAPFVSEGLEIVVEEGGRLEVVTLQNTRDEGFEVSTTRGFLEKDAEVRWTHAQLGGRVVKRFAEFVLGGEGSSALLSGLYFAKKGQHLDLDTLQIHEAPRAKSDLLMKGALRDVSRTVYQGMILVAKDAQKTDAYQMNRNLILDPHARADSIPGLEIEANDVRCTHGSTTTQIDEEQIFYLMSRGVPREEGVRMLVGGFFNEILDRVSFEPFGRRIRSLVDERIG